MAEQLRSVLAFHPSPTEPEDLSVKLASLRLGIGYSGQPVDPFSKFSF